MFHRTFIIVTRGHEWIFARCWGGIAQRLSRELFEIRIACSRSGANILQTKLQVAEHEYLRLPETIDDAAGLLVEQNFDWLHYWEIGTDAMNYYLPFFRPALGQSTCWGCCRRISSGRMRKYAAKALAARSEMRSASGESVRPPSAMPLRALRERAREVSRGQDRLARSNSPMQPLACGGSVDLDSALAAKGIALDQDVYLGLNHEQQVAVS